MEYVVFLNYIQVIPASLLMRLFVHVLNSAICFVIYAHINMRDVCASMDWATSEMSIDVFCLKRMKHIIVFLYQLWNE